MLNITDDFSKQRPRLDFVADDLYNGGLHELGRLVEAALYGGGHDLVQEVVHNSLTEQRFIFIDTCIRWSCPETYLLFKPIQIIISPVFVTCPSKRSLYKICSKSNLAQP
jgi:hypothetical protein